MEKKEKKASGFKILTFYWLFSSDIVAAKGLKKENESLLLFFRKRKKETP